MKFKSFLAIAATVTLTACATIVSGTQQTIFIDTPGAEGASCKLNDSKNGSWYLPSTPGSVSVLKGNGPMNVVCTKKGHNSGVVSASEDMSGATLGNIILGGGIGIFVDAASGAAQKYPDKIVLWMKPKQFSSPAAKRAWEADYAKYEKEIADAIAAKKAREKRTQNN